MAKPPVKKGKGAPKPSTQAARDLALHARFFDFKPRKGDLRKIEILEAAIHCLADDGIHRTTFESVGKRLGIGRAHVAYHYPNLDDLFEAAIKFCVSHVQVMTVDAVTATEDDQEKPAAFINATFEWVQRFPKHASVILLLYYLASVLPRFRKIHDDVRTLGAERLKAIAAGALGKKSPAKPAVVGKKLQSLMTGNLVDWLTTEPTESLEAVRCRTIDEAYEILGRPVPH